MSKNKLAKFADLNSFGHVIQISYSKLISEGFPLKGNWNRDFFKTRRGIFYRICKFDYSFNNGF